MLSVNKILFPVDFSERCQSAAPYVADLANRFRARLDLLHVVEGSPVEERRQQSAAALAAFAGHIPHEMYCPQTVAHGDPADAIVRYAKTHGIDIIAMPAGRRSSFSWPSASVTGKVLRHAPCAVWTGATAAGSRLGTGLHAPAQRGRVDRVVHGASASEPESGSLRSGFGGRQRARSVVRLHSREGLPVEADSGPRRTCSCDRGSRCCCDWRFAAWPLTFVLCIVGQRPATQAG